MEERFSSRTSVQMLNFITENMLCDEKASEKQIPVPLDNEWDAVIEMVQKDEAILQDLIKNVVETHTTSLEEFAAEKVAEMVTNQEDKPILYFKITEETTKQPILLAEERKHPKKTIKKRLFGFFRRSKKKT